MSRGEIGRPGRDPRVVPTALLGFVLLATVGCLTASSPSASATDVLLPTDLLLVRDSVDPTKRRIAWTVRSPKVAIPAPGSASDPRCAPSGSGAGGTLRFFSGGATSSLEDTSAIALPCEGWSLVGSASSPRGYRYRGDTGPCEKVDVRSGKKLRAVCRGRNQALAYDLEEGRAQDRISAVLSVGEVPLRHCSEVDAHPGRDGATGRLFLARNAAAPSRCAEPLDRDRDGEVRIVCLGDSNSTPGWLDGLTWCEQLAPLVADRGWVVVVRTPLVLGGASAVDQPKWADSKEQLEWALDEESPDVLLIAYGTNDYLLGVADAPSDVVEAYRNRVATAREAGVLSFVALAPPLNPADDPGNEWLEELNALLLEEFPGAIDFWSPMEPHEYLDRAHMNELGHADRAAEALATLTAANSCTVSGSASGG